MQFFTFHLLYKLYFLFFCFAIARSSNYDEHCTQVADTIFKNHGYPFAHPLEKNW